jgi:hypothetical protein
MKQATNNTKGLDLQKKTIKKLSITSMMQIQGGKNQLSTVPVSNASNTR